jgi:hypothetical protein
MWLINLRSYWNGINYSVHRWPLTFAAADFKKCAFDRISTSGIWPSVGFCFKEVAVGHFQYTWRVLPITKYRPICNHCALSWCQLERICNCTQPSDSCLNSSRKNGKVYFSVNCPRIEQLYSNLYQLAVTEAGHIASDIRALCGLIIRPRCL